MSGPTRALVRQWALQSGASIGQWGDAALGAEQLVRFAETAYAAGRAAERSVQPIAPMVIDNPDVVAVVAAAVRTEREACAEEADYFAYHSKVAFGIAAAIRARSAK